MSDRQSLRAAAGLVKGGIGDHLLDGLDAGDGLFGESEGEGEGSEQLAVDIDGTSAHAFHNAGFGERAAAEPGQNDGLFGRDIVHDAENFYLELFNAIAMKDGTADAFQAGADILEREEGDGAEPWASAETGPAARAGRRMRSPPRR